jgi:hypothetical protein
MAMMRYNWDEPSRNGARFFEARELAAAIQHVMRFEHLSRRCVVSQSYILSGFNT